MFIEGIVDSIRLLSTRDYDWTLKRTSLENLKWGLVESDGFPVEYLVITNVEEAIPLLLPCRSVASLVSILPRVRQNMHEVWYLLMGISKSGD